MVKKKCEFGKISISRAKVNRMMIYQPNYCPHCGGQL